MENSPEMEVLCNGKKLSANEELDIYIRIYIYILYNIIYKYNMMYIGPMLG